jgi:hypothetical protein
MASPFPGMDPYLEGELWQEFHQSLAAAIREQLMPHLRPKYVAFFAKRFAIDHHGLSLFDVPPDQRAVYPDVGVIQADKKMREPTAVYDNPNVTQPSAEIASYMAEEVPLISVEIRDVAERRLVSLIEILSPVNKYGDGAREYALRRESILATHTHLIELDLIRRGQRIQLQAEPPLADYYVYLSRMQKRPYTEVWAVALADPLPVIPVPLLPPDEDVLLDLQTAVSACFDLVGYEHLLDYSQPPPPPPLSGEQSRWLRRLIKDERSVSKS